MKLFHILALTSLISFVGFADETKWEVQGHMQNGAKAFSGIQDGGINIQSSSSGGAAGASTTGFGLNAGVHYSVMPWLQVGLVPGIGSTTVTLAGVSASVFNWAALLQVTANFPMDGKIADAFFLAGKIGYASQSTTAAGTTTALSGLAWGAEIGKRFAIFNNLSWKPSFGLLSTTLNPASGTGTNFMDWQINLISFAATW